MFKKILVANRGEIAVRVIRACKTMGISTVAVYVEMDRDSLHVSLADEAVLLLDRRGYLDRELLIKTAKEANCEAIHPGYGFLAENADFSRRCQEEGLTFIGPSALAMEAMGLKIKAREIMMAAGVPVVPGCGAITCLEDAMQEAEKIGYPLMIKASGGGGGRGIRVVTGYGELEELLPVCQKESEMAFCNSEVYLEKFFTNPRHIEIQILADNFGHVVHFGERECSIQRRRQKLLEESPSPLVDSTLRAEMGDAAVRAAKAIGYSGCGTVEFLVDENKKYYFLEMNTRIQVEHPVTEMVTGTDLIQEQIRVAAGETLAFQQEDITFNGWSIECRINAEDYKKNFKPSPGLIETFRPPLGPWTRMDTYIVEGLKVTPLFDSLLGKVIVWGKTRDEAIARMRLALDEIQITGPETTVPLLRMLLDQEEFMSGEYSNCYLENWLERISD